MASIVDPATPFKALYGHLNNRYPSLFGNCINSNIKQTEQTEQTAQTTQTNQTAQTVEPEYIAKCEHIIQTEQTEQTQQTQKAIKTTYNTQSEHILTDEKRQTLMDEITELNKYLSYYLSLYKQVIIESGRAFNSLMLCNIDGNLQLLNHNFNIMKQNGTNVQLIIEKCDYYMQKILLNKEIIKKSDDLIKSKHQNPAIFDSLSIISQLNSNIFGKSKLLNSSK
jgi:hypothetical protein